MAVDVGARNGGAVVLEPPCRPWVARLQAEVLLLALEDACRTGSARALRLAEDARDWLATDDDAHPFAFVVICTSLGLDASAVRAAVARRARTPRVPTRAEERRAAWRAAVEAARLRACAPWMHQTKGG